MKPKRSKEDTFVIALCIVLAVLVLGPILLVILMEEVGFGAGIGMR